MARRWFGDGSTLEYIAPGVIVPDSVIVFPHGIGIALTGADLPGQKVLVAMDGVFRLPRRFGALPQFPGVRALWDPVQNRIDNVAVGAVPAGLSWEAPNGLEMLIRINWGPQA